MWRVGFSYHHKQNFITKKGKRKEKWHARFYRQHGECIDRNVCSKSIRWNSKDQIKRNREKGEIHVLSMWMFSSCTSCQWDEPTKLSTQFLYKYSKDELVGLFVSFSNSTMRSFKTFFFSELIRVLVLKSNPFSPFDLKWYCNSLFKVSVEFGNRCWIRTNLPTLIHRNVTKESFPLKPNCLIQFHSMNIANPRESGCRTQHE